MAEFNPRTQDALAPPAYVGASEGIRGSENNGASILVEGLAKALDSGVKAVDAGVQEDIKTDVENNFDQINAEFGVDSATELQQDFDKSGPDNGGAGKPGRPVPAAITDAADNIKSLDAAFKSGAIKESYYWARMNSMVRQMRGKYPGYRSEIDQIVSDVTGSRPANQLRDSLFNEWGKEDPSAKAEREFRDAAEKAGNMPLDYYTRAQSGNPYSDAELHAYVGTKTAKASAISDQRNQMAFSVDQKNLVHDDAVKNFRTEVSSNVTAALNNVSMGAGSTYKKIMDQIQTYQGQIAKGGQITPDQQQELRQLVNQLDFTLRTQAQETAQQSWDGKDPSKSYNTQLTTDELKQATEDAMRPVTLIKDALAGDNWGMLGAVSTWLEANKNANTADALKNVPVLNVLQGFQTAAGPEVAGVYLSLLPAKDFAALTNQMLQYNVAKAHITGAPGTPPPNASQDFSDAAKSGVKDIGDGTVKYWQNLVGAYAKGDITQGNIAKDVQYLFGPANFNIFAKMDDASKVNYFSQVASPEISKQMLSLKENGDTASYNLYKQWTLNSFQALSRSALADLDKYNVDKLQMQVAFNPQSSQFVLVQNPNYNKFPEGIDPASIATFNEDRLTAVQGQLDKVNAMLRTVAPIVEDDGQSVSSVIPQLFGQFKPAAVDAKTGQANLAQEVINAVQSAADKEAGTGSPDDRGKQPVNYWETNLPFQPQFQEPVETQGNNQGDEQAPIRDVIGQAEAPNGYDTVFAGKKFDVVPTSATVADVRAAQDSLVARGSESSAVGKYQIIRSTMDDLIAKGVIAPTDKFDQATQDKAATYLIKQAGYDQWKAGKLTQDQFADNLANVWAGLPLASGRSAYAGVGSNNATVPRSKVTAALDAVAAGKIDDLSEDDLIAISAPEHFDTLDLSGKLDVLERRFGGPR